MIKVDTPQAFRTVESIQPQVNNLVEASMLVQSYQGGNNMQQCEYLVGQGMPFGTYFDQTIIRALAEKDFDRTTKLIDGFSRIEIRISLKLQLADNLSNQR